MMLDYLCALLLVLGFACAGYFGTLATLREPRGSTLVASAVLQAHAIAILLFALLGLAGLFRLDASAVAVVAVAVSLARIASRRAPSLIEPLRTLAADSKESLREPPVAFALVVVVLPFALMALRGLILPPLAWDALTYHLSRAAFWVKNASLHLDPAPDAWNGTYLHSPFGGDALWAWTMLPFGDDRFVFVTSLGSWAIVGLGVYAASRALDATRSVAALLAAAAMLLPTSVHLAPSAYVDNAAAGFLLLGGAFLLRTVRSGAAPDALLCGAGLALAATVKLSSAAFPLLGAIAVVAATRRAPVLLGYAAGVAVALPLYLRTWIATGSPLYPMRLGLPFGLGFEGYEQFVRVQSDGPPLSALLGDLGGFLRILFLDAVGEGAAATQHVNLGPGAPVLLVAGAAGAWFLGRKLGPVAALFLLACSLLPLAGLLSDDFAAQRNFWWLRVGGRLLLPAFGALAVMAAALPRRWAFATGLAVLLVELPFALPRGWRQADVDAALELLQRSLPLLVAALLLAATGVVLRGARGGALGMTAIAVALAGLLLHAPQVRREFRYAIYEEAVFVPQLYDFHPVAPLATGAWPLWERLDTPEGSRIAATAGWEGSGDNWFLYPLFGARLQNDLLYLPVSADGEIVNYEMADEVASRADPRSWLERMVTAEVDYLVTLSPQPIEREWADALPGVFRPVATAVHGEATAFAFDRDAALRVLRTESR